MNGRSDRVLLENGAGAGQITARRGLPKSWPGKVYYDDPNYSKLAYNTHFPWEDHNPAGGTAMEYSFRSLDPRDVARR